MPGRDPAPWTDDPLIESLMDSVSVACVFLDRHGAVLSFNERAAATAAAMGGTTLAAGMKLTDMLPPTVRPAVDRLLARTFAGESPEDIWSGSISGAERRFRFVFHPLSDGSGAVTRALLLTTDLFDTDALHRGSAVMHSDQRFRSLFENAADAIVLHTTGGIIIDVNDAWVAMTGFSREAAIGQPVGMTDATYGMAPPTEVAGIIRPDGTLDRGGLPITIRTTMMRADGSLFPALVRLFAIDGDTGALFGTLVSDLTEQESSRTALERAVSEREVLLRELHHRVKNNLQSMASLLRIQLATMPDAAAVAMLQRNIDRIYSMAMVHEKLYRAGDLGAVDFGEYLTSLVDYLAAAYATDQSPRPVRCVCPSVRVSVERAVPLGLIVNELVTNSFKHAADPASCTEVRLERSADGTLQLHVSNSGAVSSREIMQRGTTGFGVQLILLLTEQAGATLETSEEPGARFTIRTGRLAEGGLHEV